MIFSILNLFLRFYESGRNKSISEFRDNFLRSLHPLFIFSSSKFFIHSFNMSKSMPYYTIKSSLLTRFLCKICLKK